jgi:uncharacterized XkdX family phage protein
MDWFYTVKLYYDEGYYTADDVRVFVAQNKITADQYQQITGQSYS